MLNVIIHAKFHVDRLRGFLAAGSPKVPFSILIGTTLTTVLHYREDCDGSESPINVNGRLICGGKPAISPLCMYTDRIPTSGKRLYTVVS